jgi:SAM-dependent methyltransferase
MTTEGERAAATWKDPAFARAWTQGDAMADILAFPRAIAAAVVAHDRPGVRLIIDIGSGPGAFLAAFLDEFHGASGVWSDASGAMREIAAERLAPYGDRVGYILADMTDLAGGGVPAGADVVTTSRAAHHLDADGLAGFYAEAARHLAPGGWLVNLDHTGPEERWDERLRAVRRRFVKPAERRPSHHHDYPLPSVADHLAAFERAGITDVEIPWKAFFTCLFMGRKDG